MLSKLYWDYNLNLGIKLLDTQHIHLLDIINALINSLENDSRFTDVIENS